MYLPRARLGVGVEDGLHQPLLELVEEAAARVGVAPLHRRPALPRRGRGRALELRVAVVVLDVDLVGRVAQPLLLLWRRRRGGRARRLARAELGGGLARPSARVDLRRNANVVRLTVLEGARPCVRR